MKLTTIFIITLTLVNCRNTQNKELGEPQRDGSYAAQAQKKRQYNPDAQEQQAVIKLSSYTHDKSDNSFKLTDENTLEMIAPVDYQMLNPPARLAPKLRSDKNKFGYIFFDFNRDFQVVDLSTGSLVKPAAEGSCFAFAIDNKKGIQFLVPDVTLLEEIIPEMKETYEVISAGQLCIYPSLAVEIRNVGIYGTEPTGLQNFTTLLQARGWRSMTEPVYGLAPFARVSTKSTAGGTGAAKKAGSATDVQTRQFYEVSNGFVGLRNRKRVVTATDESDAVAKAAFPYDPDTTPTATLLNKSFVPVRAGISARFIN